jgi:hypothetical protein
MYYGATKATPEKMCRMKRVIIAESTFEDTYVSEGYDNQQTKVVTIKVRGDSNIISYVGFV